MATTPEDIKKWLEAALANAKATVKGDGHHFKAIIVCADFADKNTLQRHRMVNEAIKDKIDDNTIHALSIKTYTRDKIQ